MESFLWSTPYPYDDGGGPTRWIHVKTTEKRVVASWKGSRADHFDRTRDLPAGAVAVKGGSDGGGRTVLFEDRDACLQFMVELAEGRAERAEQKARDERAKAERYRAELVMA